MIRAALIIISALCIFFGVQRGEVDLIFSKAIRICLECVGLG